MEMEEQPFDLNAVKWNESPVSDILVEVIPGIENRPLPESTVQRRPCNDPNKALDIPMMVKQDELTAVTVSSRTAND